MSERKEIQSKLERALLDPSAVFGSPDEVVDTPDLGDTDKIRILERWESDAEQLQVATEENMGDGDVNDGALLKRVRDALARIQHA